MKKLVNKKKKFNFSNVYLAYGWNHFGEHRFPRKIAEESSGGFVLKWESDLGFGELVFKVNENGNAVCHTECMTKEFVKQAIDFWLENDVKYE